MTAKEKEELIEKLKDIWKLYAHAQTETDQCGNCYGIRQSRAEKGLEELIYVLIEFVHNTPAIPEPIIFEVKDDGVTDDTM